MVKKTSYQNLARNCGGYRYKGLRKPRCCKGVGCQKCWSIFHRQMVVKVFSPKKDFTKTDFTVILDCSGSMVRIADEMTQGLQELVRDQQSLKDDCTFTFVTFSYKNKTVIHDMPIKQVRLEDLVLCPSGMTALNDAIGATITQTKERLSHSKKQPGKILLYIITDGLENASKRYNEANVRKLINDCENNDWQITYLGHDAKQVAARLGIKDSHTSSYNYTVSGAQSVFKTTSDKLSAIRSTTDPHANLAKITQLTEADLKKLVS